MSSNVHGCFVGAVSRGIRFDALAWTYTDVISFVITVSDNGNAGSKGHDFAGVGIQARMLKRVGS